MYQVEKNKKIEIFYKKEVIRYPTFTLQTSRRWPTLVIMKKTIIFLLKETFFVKAKRQLYTYQL